MFRKGLSLSPDTDDPELSQSPSPDPVQHPALHCSTQNTSSRLDAIAVKYESKNKYTLRCIPRSLMIHQHAHH